MEKEKNTTEDHDETEIISMVDILEEEKQMEEDANAVLGGSDDKNCTYPMGYVPRQALYSCLTCCSPPDSKLAGVCLACCLECHEGHDLIELYTKRNFRCDCGNSLFKDTKCKLFKNKTENNNQNKYSHNFKGLYCTCARPYPDPDDDTDDEMLQCVVCEDWFHGRHLKSELPPVDFDEMICQSCMNLNKFLWYYAVKSPVVHVDKCENADVNIELHKSDNEGSCNEKLNESECSSPQAKSADSGEGGSSNNSTCLLLELQKRDMTPGKGATFWSNGWRTKLCHCDTCMKLYAQHAIEFITDETDTIHFYEEKGKTEGTPKSQYDKGLEALSKMERIQQIEVLHGFNDLKSELQEYLKKFAENGKVVREEDIKEFFGGMEARKKQKTGNSMSYYCK